ncbi:hypothetical protein COW94_01125 [Candidatus Peregrinibacteria bacterium CG22_combo_CG10-13_8_21_14_all_44_10]|nr:MAG: hypothetical protein AUK45_04830 [Candidatus Peregrinibacteria bacterium CG2_30_44_17]PIP66560.1 MAG: hypothetical protein COW94_01125 [Candidatus Peregrinibacteria bacterium CG22_combo_CG10-13_8_21_14_all_44_10]PIX80465.1 MAG: hypothetical protein COZ35_00655 [Candidatus Peregrinibacteria bacterium CG_4_10_14_3_um_filter_44_21]PJB89023.1 MAG: hypothetical protein CO082_02450 [Candidatus Peregrinibacteria bacterium CG_4_9_14_0_8_um_filter_44_15]
MKSPNRKPGFTLIEILIAVAVLALTLTAMANLVIVTMRANASNMNTLQGYYLAQQGLEAMRNVRDSNWLQNYGWNLGSDLWGDDFVCDPVSPEFYLLIDENTNITIGSLEFVTGAVTHGGFPMVTPIIVASAGSGYDAPWDITAISQASIDAGGAQMYVDTETAGYEVFSHDNGGDESMFSRYIKVSYEDCDLDKVEVTSVVFWNERGTDREIALSTYLTDWQSE